jgi:hypothetical protein
MKSQKRYDLSKREGDVLRFAAEHGPCSIYRMAEGTKQHYANVYNIVKKQLQPRELLMWCDNKSGMTFKVLKPGWWVTPFGMIRAIDVGADPVKMMGIAKKLEPDEHERVMMDGICRFALGLRQNWKNQTSRELLLWRYIEVAEPVMQEIERAKKHGEPFASVQFMTKE